MIFDQNGVPQYDKDGNIIKIVNKLNKKNFPENVIKVDENGVFELKNQLTSVKITKNRGGGNEKNNIGFDR